MNYKKFFWSFIGISGVALGIIAGLNYQLDYYGVFHADRLYVRSNAFNDRFSKMKHLLSNQHFKEYDSYLFGTSRVQKTDPRVTGQKTYNLGIPAGMTEEYLQQLQLLLAHGAKIKTIYIGLDQLAYSYKYQPQALYTDDMTKDYDVYLKSLVNPSVIGKLVSYSKQDVNIALVHTTGMSKIPDFAEKNIELNPEEYVKSEKFQRPDTWEFDANEFERCINNLKMIKELCDRNNIEMKAFFNPQHMTTYLAYDMDRMIQFKKELAQICPFWDFSGVNYVTTNNYFWFETSHPRPFICDKMLDIVSGNNQITWVPDFGVYVTPENVDAVCENAVREREAYDTNHEQWVPSMLERKVLTKRLNNDFDFLYNTNKW